MAVSEAPSLMTLMYIDSHKSLVCVGYKHQFDLISEDGEVSRIHTVDRQKVGPDCFKWWFKTQPHSQGVSSGAGRGESLGTTLLKT